MKNHGKSSKNEGFPSLISFSPIVSIGVFSMDVPRPCQIKELRQRCSDKVQQSGWWFPVSAKARRGIHRFILLIALAELIDVESAPTGSKPPACQPCNYDQPISACDVRRQKFANAGLQSSGLFGGREFRWPYLSDVLGGWFETSNQLMLISLQCCLDDLDVILRLFDYPWLFGS